MSQAKCKTARCRGIPLKRKDTGKYRTYCSKCRDRRCKSKNPLRYYYRLLRQHANRRKIPFTLTYEFYEKMCIEANFTEERRGRDAMCLSVDRKKSRLPDGSKAPYADDNVQIMTLSENAAKGVDDDWLSKYKYYRMPSFAEPAESWTQEELTPF